MKKLTLFLAALIASTTVLAQKAPILPKEWKGSVSATSFGAVNRFNSKHPHHVGDANAATEWNALDEARTLTIVRQEGQHLELVLKGPKYEKKWIGTISKNGQNLQIATKGDHILLNISGKTLSGCGTGRGSNGSFEHWVSHYAAICFDFTAVK
jgi:hypothetical protein